nr:MAG TPA: hypothetical protein [Caudoviricetes sp.]
MCIYLLTSSSVKTHFSPNHLAIFEDIPFI